jgi:hypothetical protein
MRGVAAESKMTAGNTLFDLAEGWMMLYELAIFIA